MASVNFSRPLTLYSDVPRLQSRKASGEGVLHTINVKSFKRAYTGLSCMLGWGEKVCSGPIAPILSSQRKILKLHATTFAIPEWFDRTKEFTRDITHIKDSSNGVERTQAVKKAVFTSVDFANTNIQAVQCLADTQLIDLTQYSPTMPHTLSAISHCLKLIIVMKEMFQSYMQLRSASGQEQPQSIQLPTSEKQAWKKLNSVRTAIAWTNTLLSALFFYLSISLSSYWILCMSTFMFTSSLAIDLYPSLPK